jgi:hypothetical protein
MRSSLRQTFDLLLVIAMIVVACVAVPAYGQEGNGCHRLRSYGGSFLEQCGDQLRSFTLSYDDYKRTPGNDLHSRFYFACEIELMCLNDPEISGRFVDPKEWRQSTQDDRTLFDLLSPNIEGGQREAPRSVCGIFGVEVGGMAGSAICYQTSEASGIAIVATAADVGFVLYFQQRNLGWAALRDKVLRMLPMFKVERASGDAALLRWMR